MKQVLFMDKYPVLEMEIPKSRTTARDIDEVIARLRARIDENPKVTFIAVFDHFAHTRALQEPIADEIEDARNLVFCFGPALPDPHVLALRPRSIGIADLGDRYHLGFLEPPLASAGRDMEAWCRSLMDA